METKMKNAPRVTQKNLQFHDQVQIKEIPRNDVNEDDEWNPNLTGQNVFVKPTKQRNVIIAIFVCGLVLLLIIIGATLGSVLSQKITTTEDESLTYNQVCKISSQQCRSSQGLSCPNGFCSCSSPYSWNTNTQTCTLLTYNQICSISNQCNVTLGLYCINQICQCDDYHTWNISNNTCTIIQNNTLNYGEKCARNSSQCKSILELTCTNNCTCQHAKVWNGSNCICPNGTFLNSSNLCETLHRLNMTCTNTQQCDIYRGLNCENQSNICVCSSDKSWNSNLELCVPRVNYSETCSHDGDCVPTLICPTVAGICNCSQYLPDHVCNCANDKYYDSNIGQCVNRASLNGACTTSANYTCLISLYCNAGICNCPLGTTWLAANSTCV